MGIQKQVFSASTLVLANQFSLDAHIRRPKAHFLITFWFNPFALKKDKIPLNFGHLSAIGLIYRILVLNQIMRSNVQHTGEQLDCRTGRLNSLKVHFLTVLPEWFSGNKKRSYGELTMTLYDQSWVCIYNIWIAVWKSEKARKRMTCCFRRAAIRSFCREWH